eukprot:gene14111-30031_t
MLLANSTLLSICLIFLLGISIIDSKSRDIYDKGVTLFSPEGSLLQIDYANVAADKGQMLACIQTIDGQIILCSPSLSSLSLLDRRAVDKISPIEDNIWVAFAGLAGDGRALIAEARSACRDFRMRFGCAPSVSYLAQALGEKQHAATLKGGERPFGVKMLICGYDVGSKVPAIFLTTASGEVSQWRAVAIGQQSGKINDLLESTLPMNSISSTNALEYISDLTNKLQMSHELEYDDFNGYDFYILSLSSAQEGHVQTKKYFN